MFASFNEGLEKLFKLGCLSLLEFLADPVNGKQNQKKLWRCEQCNNFFVKKRNDPQPKFCSKSCRFSFYKMSPETRKDYQAGYRENRWLDGLKKRFKEEGYTWEENKKCLEKAKQLRKEKYSRKQVESYLDENM